MCFMPYPTKPKGGWQRPCQVVVNKSTAQIQETEVCEQISGHLSEQYGRGTQRSSGSIFLPRRRQDICLPSRGDAIEHTEESTFRENAKGLSGRRHRNPQDINGKGPCNPCVNPTRIFMRSGSRDNASDEQSSDDEGNGRKCDCE